MHNRPDSAHAAKMSVPKEIQDEPGHLVAKVLTHAWRQEVMPALLSPDDVTRVVPLLHRSGAAALGARMLAASAPALQDAARLLAISDAISEIQFGEIARLFGDEGITPLLFKGLAAARHYPQSYLRPFGDFDLLFSDMQFDAAQAALTRRALPQSNPALGYFVLGGSITRKPIYVDLHRKLSNYYRTSTDALLSRAVRVTGADEPEVLMPALEDHLRIVTLHFLGHGGWRPIWLCDVAALLESATGSFDWDACLTEDLNVRRWMRAGIALAHALLDSSIDCVPEPVRMTAPGWLASAVLKEWSKPFPSRFLPLPMAGVARPLAWLSTRWPAPIVGAFRGGADPVRPANRLQQISHFLRAVVPAATANTLSVEWWRSSFVRTNRNRG